MGMLLEKGLRKGQGKGNLAKRLQDEG